ncbi:MAG: IPExxxVDY family protein [Chitinophagaceae bacterium]
MAAAKKILKLDQFEIEDVFFENAALIGISSDKPIYSLCHFLNQAFLLDFERTTHLDVQIGKKNATYSFAVYQSPVCGSAFVYTLYKLKVEDVLLLPSLKNIDYIWLITDDDPEDRAMHYLRYLRQLPEVQFAGLLEKDKIKNIDYLIL